MRRTMLFMPGSKPGNLLNGDVYGYKQKEQVSEQVVSWMDCDINSDNIWGTYSLEDGRILETGTPEHFFENPENPRCREFLSKILHWAR